MNRCTNNQVDCPTCQGEGYIETYKGSYYSQFLENWEPLETSETCPTCHGAGSIEHSHLIAHPSIITTTNNTPTMQADNQATAATVAYICGITVEELSQEQLAQEQLAQEQLSQDKLERAA
jgi:DnaJ-class molecular chaperone